MIPITRRAALLGISSSAMTCLLGRRAFAAPDPVQWGECIEKAIQFLRSSQALDGSFSKDRSPGITGIVVTGILRSSAMRPDDPFVARSLGYIESLVDKSGHIAGQNPHNQLKNYVTSVNLMAFAAVDKALKDAGRPTRYGQYLRKGAKFLTDLQWDEGENLFPKDDFYGGLGYDSNNRPDMSNTSMGLEALNSLRELGIPETDPAFQRALVFVSRCQNLKGEFNDQPWAAKINDGSFIYSAAAGGQTKADVRPSGGLVGYGSMTYAGIKSMIYAGVGKDDQRIKAAWEWIRKHYTLEKNPGMPPARDQQGLFYYYHTMAKCLDLMEVDMMEDDTGKKHDWKKGITEALAKRQQPDGSWINESDRWMEGDPNLVTGYALMALAYCKP